MLSAVQCDLNDPLAPWRSAFVISNASLIYLDGNSLGRMPHHTLERVQQAMRWQWAERLVRSWSEWFELPTRIGDKLADLLGARAGEIVVCDSTSVNFYKLAAATLAARPDRRRVVTEASNFPSDLYLLQGLGVEVTQVGEPGRDASPEEIEAALGPDVAFVTLSHVAFRTGAMHDLPRITAAARAVGAWTLWDLSHSVGAVPVGLADAGVELAVGCTYKHVSGGPGGVAFLYVRHDLQDQLVSPIQGWFGQQDAFEFGTEYTPATGIRRFLAGTPPVLSLVAVEPGVDLLREAGITEIRKKSVALSERYISLAEEHLFPLGFSLGSPRDPARRGSHVTLRHPEAWRICQALVHEHSVIPDFRAPDGLRSGFCALYNTYWEIDEAVRRIRDCVHLKTYTKYSDVKSLVT